MKKRFKIKGPYDQNDKIFLYWSNEDGWVSFDSATIFYEHELECIRLPMETTYLAYLNGKGKITRLVSVKVKEN